MLESARLLSKKAHSNQVDKAGVDYFSGHIKTVVSGVTSIKEKIVAYLHDTVEDTDITIEKIYEEFGEEIGDAVKAITKSGGLDYTEYIEAIKANELARAVKIADLKHNMDLSRLKVVGEKDVKRVEKYRKVLGVLEGE
ncbi:MAG: GTP pyrophosphokinase [Lachnoanaerobaculum sp.]|nr:GTP pyrophosphokinase [Lachnoanaerobaculum sp.]